MAIYWPTPGFKGRMSKLCVLTRWDFNFCIRSSPLRDKWWGFQISDTLQDSTDKSSIDKVEASLVWQEYFSWFQGMTDATPSSCMLVNHEPSQQSSKEYKPRKWGATARYYASHIRTMLPTRKLVHAKIQQAIGPHKDLLTIVKRCKLQWYGHLSHSSGLVKTILQSRVKGGRRQGRQKKRWEDTIREWTGLEFAKSQRAVENRKKWLKYTCQPLSRAYNKTWFFTP